MKLPHLEWVNQDSPYLRQHQQGFRGLRFDDELEQTFKRYHANVFLRRMRWSLLVATLLALLFVLLDAINLPDPLRGRILALRLGVIQPLLLLAWLATYRPGLRDHLQLIGGIVALLSGLAVAAIIGLARYHSFALPYEGIILVTVFFYFLTGLRFTTAVLCGWLTLLAYLAVELSAGLVGELLLSNVLFLTLANIIGSVGCYSLEYTTRQNFLAHGLLQDLAEKDFLTGLLNRRAFTERAELSWRQAQREKQALGVVMMDVDFFKRYHANVFLRRMRWSLLVATLLALLFVLLDAINLPDPLRGRILALRLGVIQPLLLLAWLATYRPGLRDHLQLIGGIVALLSGLAVAAIIGLARYHSFALPYEGIILVTVFFYFLTGLRFTTAVLCGWLTLLAYLAVELSAGLVGELLLSNVLFLTLANIIGSVGCYSLEYATRQNFLAHGLLQDLAEKDFLTGLLNRRAFTERAELSWRQAQREKQALGVVMMDVDFFKRYNDHYGHAAGDEALRQVSRVIGEHARRPLDCAARYGGEEFVGIWYGLTEEQLLAIMENIRAGIEALALSHVGSDAANVVTLSLGMAYVTPQTHQSLEDALRLADVALYLAKEQGRNRVVAKKQAS